MEAMEYLHSQNVYYGDMKEANLLIFRDYSVKIGDFGISIKMKDNVKPGEADEYPIKGLTPGYITD
jgi:serine/threonine protein kinase